MHQNKLYILPNIKEIVHLRYITVAANEKDQAPASVLHILSTLTATQNWSTCILAELAETYKKKSQYAIADWPVHITCCRSKHFITLSITFDR